MARSLEERSAARELWTFSLAVYDRPAVATACLSLQDRQGLDVNLLLFCCWAGARGQKLTKTQLKRLVKSVAGWQQGVVLPLRAARRHLKGERDDDAQDLRAKLLQLEIEAERQEQLRLARLLPIAAGAPEPRLAAANLLAYVTLAAEGPAPIDTADLASLLTGSFPDLPPLAAIWFLLP